MRRNPPEKPLLSAAQRTSHTRFGPRPVPDGAPTGKPVRAQSRHTYGVASQGRDPSLAAKIVVWGGLAIGTAGLTAGGIMIARKLGGLISDDAPHHAGRSHTHHGPRSAPQFAALDDEAREQMRRRDRDRARQDAQAAATTRAEASRLRPNPPRAGRGNVARELTDTAHGLSSGLTGVAGALSAAFLSFRNVASQATGIVGEFSAAADQLRAIMDRAPKSPQGSSSVAASQHAASQYAANVQRPVTPRRD